MRDDVFHIGIVGQAAVRPAGRDVRKYQKADLIVAVAGHHDILRQRRQRGDACDAQSADIDPGAGIELEVFRDTAVEKQAEFRTRRIGEALASVGRAGGSSGRVARAILLPEPPSLDGSEITDKGYINQRAVLDRRADRVELLYRDPPADEVILIDIDGE